MTSIKLVASLRELAGGREIDVPFEGGTVHELLEAICIASPALYHKIVAEDGTLTGLVHVFVDGRNIAWLNGLDTPIDESHELMLIPPVAGG